jgi:hypothetical protein
MHAEPPCLADKTVVFSEHEVFKVVVMVTIILLRIFLQMKNPLKMSLLITKLSIPQTYICYYPKYKLQFKVKFNLKRFARCFKMFFKKTKLPLSKNFEFEIK